MKKASVEITVSLLVPVENSDNLYVAEEKAMEWLENCIGYGENYDHAIEVTEINTIFTGDPDFCDSITFIGRG